MTRTVRRAALPLLTLVVAAACSNTVGDTNGSEVFDETLDSALVQGIGGLSFVSISHGHSYENGFLLAVRAPEGTTRVEYAADGARAGVSTRPTGGYGVVVTVPELGYTVVAARALNASGRVLGEVQAGIIVENERRFEFVSPEREGGTYTNGVWFKTQGPTQTARVRYSSDGWTLGESTLIADDFALRYTFSRTGSRTVLAEAFDVQGNLLDQISRTIVVVANDDDASGDASDSGSGGSGSTVPSSIPYFYQYANQLSPGATCQNTSIAMVLAAFGWGGHPDDITAEFGRSYAQSPAGLEDVFNRLAQRSGISARIEATQSGTIAGLRALASAGKPTIVHGYFTSYGHVLVVTGFDGTHYTVNDPAGTWNRIFQGGYPYGWEPTAGRGIRYPKAAFELAVGSYNGVNIADGSLWYHVLQ